MKNVALITGASSGIGLELARLHASKGGDLVLVARSTTRLLEIKQELEKHQKVEVLVLPKDLSIPGSAEEIYKEIQVEAIQLDVLMNNAGFGDFGIFHEGVWDRQEEMINLNILSLTHLTHLVLPDMLKRGKGKILQVASTAAFQPGPLMAVYYASKSYVLSFSEALANELKGTGVTVTTLCPGATQSNFAMSARMEESKLFKSQKLPSAAKVARYGYRAMMKGKTVVIQGTMNKLLANSVRFSPRKLVTSIARKMQEPEK